MNSPTRAPSSIPADRPTPGFVRRMLLPAFVLLIGAAGVGAYFLRNVSGYAAPFSGPLWEVKKEKLQFLIVERGALESAENSDIVCRVKAGAKGSTIATTIKWVIDDGTRVDKGQLLVQLDDSGLQEQLKNQNNTVNQAKAALVSAEENVSIVQSQNFSEIETAKTSKILTELDLRKYLGETPAETVLKIQERPELQKYVATQLVADIKRDIEKVNKTTAVDVSTSEILQTLSDIEGRIEIARSEREQWVDRAAWSLRMVGKGYLSRSQADAEKARLDSSDFNLKKVVSELDLFKKYTVERTVTDLWSKVKEADRALERTKVQAKAKEVQAMADRDSKKAVFEQEESRQWEVKEEIRKCSLYSPQEGLVVYFVAEQSRFGSGSQQSIVAQGEPVREGQKLMRIPNLARMLVSARVHEAMVSRLKGEVLQPTGFSDAIRASMIHLRDPLDLTSQIMIFEDQRDSFKELEFRTLKQGQKAYVKVDAYPGKMYSGHVKTVATVASQADFMASDVKVYQTMVSMDGLVDSLKPGMSAEVTILADESGGPVLTVPIQSVVGAISMGASRKVYVLDEQKQPKQRDIVVGMSNDQMVEVKSGLEEGDKVVLNPRPLLGDKNDMRPGTPGKSRGADTEGTPIQKGGGKKKGMGGGPPPGGPDMPTGGPFSPSGPPGGPPGGPAIPPVGGPNFKGAPKA
ncbi:MAG: hypothetical protein K2X38_06845 [Gemmataceae bacterium]|nr:hypothetical protein [Gemmataceae bacterium]